NRSGIIIAQNPWSRKVASRAARLRGKEARVYSIPQINFIGLHPDAVHAAHAGARIWNSVMPMNSAIALYAWTKGLTPEDTVKLFTPRTFEKIGYYNYWDVGIKFLCGAARCSDVPLDRLLPEWAKRNPFMHMPQHPKLFALADIARRLAE